MGDRSCVEEIIVVGIKGLERVYSFSPEISLNMVHFGKKFVDSRVHQVVLGAHSLKRWVHIMRLVLVVLHIRFIPTFVLFNS
jgi:hypothetical protein